MSGAPSRPAPVASHRGPGDRAARGEPARDDDRERTAPRERRQREDNTPNRAEDERYWRERQRATADRIASGKLDDPDPDAGMLTPLKKDSRDEHHTARTLWNSLTIVDNAFWIEVHLPEPEAIELMSRVLNDAHLDDIETVVKWTYNHEDGIRVGGETHHPDDDRALMDKLSETLIGHYLQLQKENFCFTPHEPNWKWLWDEEVAFPKRVRLQGAHRITSRQSPGHVHTRIDTPAKRERDDEQDETAKWYEGKWSWKQNRSESWSSGDWKGNTASDEPINFDQLSSQDKNRAWKWYRPEAKWDASPAPVRASRHAHEDVVKTSHLVKAEEWLAMAPEAREAMDLSRAEERELSVAIIKNMQKQTDINTKTANYHHTQIEIAQKASTSCQVRLNGFFKGWPSQINRENALSTVMETLGMYPRDIHDLQEQDFRGELPPSPIITLRNESRKNRLLSKAFSEEFKNGVELANPDDPNQKLTLWFSTLDIPIKRKAHDVKRALVTLLHENAGGNANIKKFYEPDFKGIVEGELVVLTQITAGKIIIKARADWAPYFSKHLWPSILMKSAPKHIKDAFEEAIGEQSNTLLDDFIARFPYALDVIAVEYFEGSPFESFKSRKEGWEKAEKGKGKGKRKGTGGKGKRKGQERDERENKDHFPPPAGALPKAAAHANTSDRSEGKGRSSDSTHGEARDIE